MKAVKTSNKHNEPIVCVDKKDKRVTSKLNPYFAKVFFLKPTFHFFMHLYVPTTGLICIPLMQINEEINCTVAITSFQ